MQNESTVTGRRIRNLGLSVFNPDNSSDDDAVPIQRNTPQTTAQLLPKPLPVPSVAQGSYFPQQPPLQQLQSPYTARPAQRQPSHPIHSASSSTSSISISTSLSSQPGFQFPNGARQAGAQSSPTSRYANASPLNYVGSSSSSRSSPAMDTTPPPTTPSNTLPPVNFAGGVTDDRNLDGLGLDVASETDYPASSSLNQSRPDPRNGMYGDHSKNIPQPQQAVNPSPAPTPIKPDRREPLDKLIITVTADAENHVIVDISGAKDAAFIRERMFSKLRIPDDDHENYQIYRTELGEAALGDPVTDDQLMIYCEAWADAKGTLKFLVQRNPAAPPPQPQFTPPSQSTATPHVQTPPAIPNPTPPLFSPAYDRRRAETAGGGLPSADRDRPPWDPSNGYDGDVDGSNRRRHQSPAPIDTSRRKREPSASGSDMSSFSPTSPSGPPSSMTPLIGMPSRRPQPSQLSTVAAAGAYLNPNTPVAHRRRESDTAALEREQAFEAQERYREAQKQEYDSQYKKGRAEKDRQNRRQQHVHSSDGSTPSGHRAQRSESVDSGAPHGWVLVNEVFPTPTSSTGPERFPNTGQRTPSYGRSNTTGAVGEWAGSPPSDSSRFSPASATTPSASRPYPHATNMSYPSTTPTLQRAHPPLPASGKYPSPHPHPRTGHGSHAPLPPGAVDPRMRQIERQQQPTAPPAQFYSPSIASYNPPPATYNAHTPQQSTPPSSRMLQPAGSNVTVDTTGSSRGTLRSPRSMSDLNQRSAMNSAVSPPTSHSSNQIPTLGRKPNALPTSSLGDSLYNNSRPPTSPSRLQSSPIRPIINPTLLHNGSAGGSARNHSTQQDYGNGLPRSLGSGAGLFSSGVFADGPLTRNPGLRLKPSSDRLGALDRTMAAHAQPQNRDQGPTFQGPPQPTPSTSSTYRYDWMTNTTSPAPSRPNSGDVDNGDFNRPSPIEQSATDVLSMIESRRPSLPTVNVAPTPFEPSERLASPWAETAPTTGMQIPKAVVTPSSPIDPSTATIGVQLYDNPSPVITTATSPALSAMSSTEFTDDGSEGTLKPGDRERLLSMAGSDNDADEEDTGTMKPRTNQVSFSSAAPVVITGKATRVPVRTARALSVHKGAPTQTGEGQDAQPHGENEEEEYYSDSDSSEEDERFWNNAPSATATPPATKTSGPEDEGSSTLGPINRGRGPNLTVMISPLVDDRGSPMPTPSTAATNLPTSRENSPSPSPASGLTPTSGINRRASFRRDTWAFRPIQEDVLDHLQDFFPDHDLDKPFIDQVQIANEGLSSPAGEALPPPVPPPVSKEAKFKHRKSIRFVAEERKKVLERVGSAREPSTKAANLGRKRSTKLWGIKVEEVTPGQVKSGVPPTIPESPTGPAPRPTIKWVKGELIGKGTYGRVFLAFNVTTGEMMAVKQVEMPQTISDQDDVRQVNIVKALESEQQTLEKLDHPNIVQYLGFEKTKEFFSVFLEYVPGGSIGSCLRRHGKFEENIIKSFTGQIIDGLAYLHANKIIHRDIKADNVLVDPSGNCKISDFGISKQSEEIYNNAAMTAMQGSLFWMAPEMLHNDKKGYNAKIDIWSLGCVFIEMFAGRRPWEQDDFVSVMFKVGRNKMAPPVPSDVHLSAEAEDFRLKCFTQDPDERPTAEGLKGHPWLTLPPGWNFLGFH